MILSKLDTAKKLLRQRGVRETARIVGSRLVGGDYGRPQNQRHERRARSAWEQDYPVEYYELHQDWLGLYKDVEAAATPAGKVLNKQNIAIIADLNLPQCKKYRVMQKLEAFNKVGIHCTYSHWQDQPRSLNLMQLATTVIFYRIPCNDVSEFYFKEAARLGVRTAYDIDDPIFDDATYEINANLDFLTSEERKGLLAQCSSYAAAMRKADFVLVSTPGMAELAKRHYDGPIYLWRNLLDRETLSVAERVNKSPTAVRDKSRIVIGYMSGSRAHEADFRSASTVLAEVMRDNEDIELHVVGHLEVPEGLEEFTDRIQKEPFTNYEDYIARLHDIDLNIIPLKIDGFNECKSAIRYMEASIVGVPTIVSNVGDFKEVVAAPGAGFLAETDVDWRRALEELTSSESHRRAVGKAAQKHVLSHFSLLGIPIESAAGFMRETDGKRTVAVP